MGVENLKLQFCLITEWTASVDAIWGKETLCFSWISTITISKTLEPCKTKARQSENQQFFKLLNDC